MTSGMNSANLNTRVSLLPDELCTYKGVMGLLDKHDHIETWACLGWRQWIKVPLGLGFSSTHLLVSLLFLLSQKNQFQLFFKITQVTHSPSGHCHSIASTEWPLGIRAFRQINTA